MSRLVNSQTLPNIVLFIADHWRGKDVGCLGNPVIQTPHTDRLTEEGVAFANCFAQSTICTSSHCSFMTGWYPHVRGHRTMHHVLSPDEPFLLKQLMDQGYFVWWGGKNNVVRIEEEGNVCSLRFRAESATPDDDALVDGAIQFLENASPQPFCICLTLHTDRTDDDLGRLTKALNTAGHWENTAIFVFSDHGEYAGHYHMTGTMQTAFDDDLTKVPLVIKYPSSIPIPKRGQPVDSMVELIDVYATVCDLAKLRQRHTHFGKSLIPISTGETGQLREQVFCEGGVLASEPHTIDPLVNLEHKEAHGKAVMVRTGEWKFVKRLYTPNELYDLNNDPDERRNLAYDPRYAAVCKDMLNRLALWYLETVDVVPYEPVLHKLEGRL